TGRIDGDQLVVGRAHGSIDGIACAQRLAAALAGPMPGIERVGPMHVRLHRALVFREKPVAHGERAGLIELDLRIHDGYPMLAATVPMRRRMASAVGPVRRALLSRSSSKLITSALRSRNVTCSSSSRPASSNSRVSEARVMARPPRPAMTV